MFFDEKIITYRKIYCFFTNEVAKKNILPKGNPGDNGTSSAITLECGGVLNLKEINLDSEMSQMSK